MKKMYCFDVDNTIFSHVHYEISAGTLQAIETLRKGGHLIILATGRYLFDPHSINIVEVVKPDAIVHSNGLKVTIGNEVYYEHLFDKQLLKQVLDFSSENGLIIGSSINNVHYFTNPETLLQIGPEKMFKENNAISSFEELMEQPIYSLNFFGQESQLEILKSKFPQLHYFMFAIYEGADVMDIGVSKADGIERLLGFYSMSWEDVVCFGDSSNDISMLEKAQLGIAMGNAIDSVKACADYVTKDIEEDGVAYVIENFELISKGMI